MQHPIRSNPGHAALLGLLALALGACSRDSGDSPGQAGAATEFSIRARERDPEVIALRLALDLGRLEEARPILREWRARLGLEGELLGARAAALENDVTALSRQIEAAREMDPEDPRVYATAAELHAAAGRFETARQEIRLGFEATGTTPELLRAQGVIFLCQPRGAAKGMELIESALARDPELPFVDRALSQAQLLLGKQDLSESHTAAALEHGLQAVARDPEDIEVRRFLADAFAADQRMGESVAVLQELVDEGQPLEAELAMSCKRAAMGELIHGRRPEAIEYFRRARWNGLDDQALGTGTRMLLEASETAIEGGIAAYAAEDLPRARAHFGRALELDPDSIVARNHLGVALFKDREFAAAADQWRLVLEVALAEGIELPEPVHLNLAKALVRSGREDAARDVIRAYLERDPDGAWAPDSRAILRKLEG